MSDLDKDLKILVLRYQLGIADRKLNRTIKPDRSEGIHVISTPFRAPNAKAFAERWVRTLRVECLDNVLILNETLLRRVIDEYVAYYNSRRPHQSSDQQTPVPSVPVEASGRVQRRKVPGGIINDYFRLPGQVTVTPGR